MQRKKRLLAVDRVAEYLGISQNHVMRLATKGEIPAPIRLGCCVRWDAAGLDRWLKELDEKAQQNHSGKKGPMAGSKKNHGGDVK